MKEAARILILGNYNSSKNVYFSEIETFKGLKEQGFHITIMGYASEEIQAYFDQHHIAYIDDQPQKKFDKKFTRRITQIIEEKKIEILYVRNGKHLRSFLPFFKKKNVKIVTYYGSSSLHWHDPMAYFSYLNPKVDKIVCNSSFVYQHVRKQLFGKAKAKAVKIYKGYNPHWFTRVKPFDYTAFDIPSSAIKVIMVGRNSTVKDIPTFLKTAEHFKDVPSIHFILVGDQLTPEHLTQFPRIIAQKNVHLLGFRKDAPSLIKGADIYIQTSISEGLGRGISEAAAMGKPVIMTHAGGCTELIYPDKSGFIVPKKDHQKLAEHIQYLADNPTKRKAMGEQAIQKIEQDLSMEQTITDFSQLFKQIK